MAFKDLLVYAGAGGTTPICLDVASALAAGHNAHLTALHVIQPPLVPVDASGFVAADVIQQLEDQERERAEVARRLVTDAERRNGRCIEHRAVDGDTITTALLHSRYADLVIVGQDGGDDPAGYSDLAEAIVMDAGRPVLVVPQAGKFSSVGKRVLVAWKQTAEATRAVHDALPLLRGAEAVVVMEVNPPTERVPHIAGVDIATHLARHDVRAEVSSTTATEIGIGDVILSRAAELGADTIVMGAYGHSRLREFVFGGVTLHLLRHMTVPVFMSR
ncbi:MAG TPA: universal stress protein [Vicinamibacterales bacterium]